MPRVALPALLPAVLAAVLLAGGCGDPAAPAADRAPGAAQSSPAPRSAPQSAPSSAPTGAPEPTATPTRPDRPATAGKPGRAGGGKVAPALPLARGAGAREHLLPVADLPRAGGGAWSERSTRAEGSRLVGACHRATLVDIGALDALVRVATGAEGSGLRARQAVARYADAKSAWRAHQVLRAWRGSCEDHLDHPTEEVGPMERLTLDPGAGGRYPLTYGAKKSPLTSSLGIVREGRWLCVVEIRSTEGEVPAGWTRRAARRIAATF